MAKRLEYSLGQRVIRSEKHPKKWRDIKPSDIAVDRPLILCLGGNGTVTDRLANGYAKAVESMMGIEAEDNFVDIYSLHYGGQEDAAIGNVSTDEIEELAKGILIKRVQNENGDRLALEQAMKNMRNVNVVTFSFGANVLKHLMNYTAQYMEYNLGYDEDEIQDVLKQVLQVSFAPSVSELPFTTNFVIKSLQDRQFDYASEYKALFGSESVDYGKLIKDNNTITMYVNRLSDVDGVNEHDICLLRRPKDFLTENKRANFASMCVSYVLSIGVLNSKENMENGKFIPFENVEQVYNILNTELKKENEICNRTKFNKDLSNQ